ncbi:MAG: hypothetical protein NZ735_00295 [Candidatus Marinimicrobia bacterium]|nr:hypothetical protein [Candidatus Neomarinimicrobiota bacterium]
MTHKTNCLDYVDFIGVECNTVEGKTPYFFIFSDIDTKDTEVLRKVLKIYGKFRLSFLWYETFKGFHVVSPCLVSLTLWDSIKTSLKAHLDSNYHNLVIRVEYKHGDSRYCNWENQDTRQKFLVSDNLLSLYEKKFQTSIPCPNRVKTSLIFTTYTQVYLKGSKINPRGYRL